MQLSGSKNKSIIWIYKWTRWTTRWLPAQFKRVVYFHRTVPELTVQVHWPPRQPIWQQFGSDPDPDPKRRSATVANTTPGRVCCKQWTIRINKVNSILCSSGCGSMIVVCRKSNTRTGSTPFGCGSNSSYDATSPWTFASWNETGSSLTRRRCQSRVYTCTKYSSWCKGTYASVRPYRHTYGNYGIRLQTWTRVIVNIGV